MGALFAHYAGLMASSLQRRVRKFNVPKFGVIRLRTFETERNGQTLDPGEGKKELLKRKLALRHLLPLGKFANH